MTILLITLAAAWVLITIAATIRHYADKVIYALDAFELRQIDRDEKAREHAANLLGARGRR